MWSIVRLFLSGHPVISRSDSGASNLLVISHSQFLNVAVYVPWLKSLSDLSHSLT